VLDEILAPGEEASVYIVGGKAAAATSNGPWFGSWPPPNGLGNLGIGHNGSQIVVKGATNTVSISAATDPDEWHLISIRKTNTTMFVDLDGVGVFSSTIPSSLNLQYLGLGAYNPAPLTGSAVVGELLVLGGFASDDLHAEETYRLLQKFRIPLP